MSTVEPHNAGKLSRFKHFLHKENDPSLATLHDSSNNNSDDGLTRSSSIDSASERLAPVSRTSSENQARRSLSKLVPNKFKRRASTQDDISRVNSHTPIGSLREHNDSRRSSLVTDASDIESHPRPTLSTHSSHKEHLTQSSPLLQIETTTAIPDPEPDLVGTLPEITRTKSSPALLSFDSPSEYHFCVTAPTPTDSVSPDVNWHKSEDPSTPARKPLVLDTTPATPPATHAPSTVVTPPTPTSHAPDVLKEKAPAYRHRKSPSVGSSKLAHATTIDDLQLTPPVEEQKTPGGSLTAPTPSSGFFSGFISAAQTAATNLVAPKRNVSLGVAQAAASSSSLPQLHMQARRSVTEHPVSRPRSMTSPEPSDERQVEVEDAAAARAVSTAYDKSRPASITSSGSLQLEHANTLPLEHSPSRTSTLAEPEVKRSGSVRSKLSRRRHRGSSVGTATALSASTVGPSHRHTGFAVASTKRNKEFHQLFRSVPEDDYLIEDYSAALQKDILLHGRFYVSEGHICFMSNILGWVTNLVIAFDEIVSIEKKNTAIVFPNALSITTHQARSTFASFVTRDATYDLLLAIWKTTHPNLQISMHGVTLPDHAEPEKKVEADSSSEVSDDVYDEDDDDAESIAQPVSVAGSEVHDTVSRKPSVAAVSITGLKSPEVVTPMTGLPSDFPGPGTHAPTECADKDSHYDKHLIDTTINAPLGKVYNLWFGPASGVFMRKWLVDDQKSRELSYEDDKTGLDGTHKSFTFSYVKPLSGPVGPKQTRCIVTNTATAFDLEKAITIDASTHTPDVPSGGIFTVKTRYCLMWGPSNSTRIIASCTLEWTGKSWLKGPIESGANAGQLAYVNDLMAAIKAAASSTSIKTRKGKARRRKDTTLTTDTETIASPRPVQASETNWGVFEPIHGVLRPVLSLVSPFLTSQVVIAVLFVLLMQSWFYGRRTSGVGRYEELYRAEENELWDWLETRVVVDPMAAQVDSAAADRQAVLEVQAARKRVKDERMNQRQVEDAIKITERRLGVLKEAVART